MLSEVLYYIFIFPLQGVLDFLINLFFTPVKNYGVSIIFLSIFVNLFLLKLTFIFDLKAQKFTLLKAECNKKILEFKKVFKGAELQSYIRTLYKQKHFHPIYALQGLGGLALQIPFFIAMYLLVQEKEYFSGASFLYISDLSSSDFLVEVFGVSIHLLPILMSIFTLVNVFVSSGDRGARIQGVAITLIFLVLLYDMPSALVLYWTCNMLFAMLRAIYKHSCPPPISFHT